MPKIPPRLQDCVFYLYSTPEAAEQGTAAGGCGFLLSYQDEIDPEIGHAYAVTCRHLVDKGHLTIRLNNQAGSHEIVETALQEWEQSRTNDLAVRSIDLDDTKHHYEFLFHAYILPEGVKDGSLVGQMITQQIINDFGIGMGDDIYLVGRLIDHSGKQRNTPSARFGNIAMMPYEKIYNWHIDKEVDAFLCEVKSIGGFSGSPVFVHIPPFAFRPGDDAIHGRARGPWLLGIDWGHTTRNDWVRDANDNLLPNYHVRRNSGITCVAPAWELLPILNSDRFKAERAKTRVDYYQITER